MLNKILMGMGMLAADDTFTDATKSVLQSVLDWIWAIMGTLLGIAIAVAIVYAIVVGAKVAKADNAEQREEAKKKIVYTVIGIAVAIVLILVLLLLKTKLPDWIQGAGGNLDIPDSNKTTGFIGLL